MVAAAVASRDGSTTTCPKRDQMPTTGKSSKADASTMIVESILLILPLLALLSTIDICARVCVWKGIIIIIERERIGLARIASRHMVRTHSSNRLSTKTGEGGNFNILHCGHRLAWRRGSCRWCLPDMHACDYAFVGSLLD